MNRYKLLLINPKTNNQSPKFSFIPPIALGILAALTPKNWEVQIIDENINSIPESDFDLIGITSNTLGINHVYEIAESWKKRSIPIILGGGHASMMPEEAIRYADAVLIGNAENNWPKLIKDFENGNLQRIYANTTTALNFVSPDISYFGKDYFADAIETSRGCNNNCNFCGIHVPRHMPYIRKPVEMVIEEMQKSRNPFAFFIDNNFYGNDDAYLFNLFETMLRKRIRKAWIAGMSVNFFQNKELVNLAAKSGGKIFFVGFESDTTFSLSGLNKNNFRDPMKIFDEYKSIVNDCHKHKILVIGNVMIGIENDTEESIKERFSFFSRLKLDECHCVIVTPLPNTILYKKYLKEGRLLYTGYPKDWEKYHYGKNVIRHDNISLIIEDLAKNARTLFKQTNSKILSSYFTSKSFKSLILYYNYCSQFTGYQNERGDKILNLIMNVVKYGNTR